MMTLEEQKLAVCEKLPELIDIDTISMTYPTYWWTMKGTSLHQIDWPTEGLQVCHEAEMLMDDGAVWKGYCNRLWDVVCPERPQLYGLDAAICLLLLHATYEQRLEALCRVWWPERF